MHPDGSFIAQCVLQKTITEISKKKNTKVWTVGNVVREDREMSDDCVSWPTLVEHSK